MCLDQFWSLNRQIHAVVMTTLPMDQFNELLINDVVINHIFGAFSQQFKLKTLQLVCKKWTK